MSRLSLRKLFGFEDHVAKRLKLRERFPLRLERMEDRVVPATSTAWVNDNWNLIADNDSSNSLTAGDTVRNDNDTLAPGTITKTYGTDAFGTVTTSSLPGIAGIPGSVSGFATINDAITNTNVGGTVNLLTGT